MSTTTDASPSNEGHLPDLPTRPIEKDEYVDLWQYFSDRADILKDKLWTIATWLLALVSGLLGYIFSQEFIVFSHTGLSVQQASSAFVLAIVGILLCLFSLLVVVDYGNHIRRNWDRAGLLKDRIIPLGRILKADSNEDEDEGGSGDESARDEKPNLLKSLTDLPKVCRYLVIIVLGYLIIFLVVATLALIHM